MTALSDAYDIEMQLLERKEIQECKIKIEEGNGVFQAIDKCEIKIEECKIKIEECKIQIEDDDGLFEAIDKLIPQGINVGDVKQLQDAGIDTCSGLMMKNLTGTNGLSESKVDQICEAAEHIVNFGYMTGSDTLRKRKLVERITTGCQVGERKDRNQPCKRKETDDDDDESSILSLFLASFVIYFIFVFPFLLFFVIL